jgi:hypothetical protein
MIQISNFEKWKQETSIEWFLKLFKDNGCNGCPALEVCKNTKGCEKAFRKWAKQETTQSEKN